VSVGGPADRVGDFAAGGQSKRVRENPNVCDMTRFTEGWAAMHRIFSLSPPSRINTASDNGVLTFHPAWFIGHWLRHGRRGTGGGGQCPNSATVYRELTTFRSVSRLQSPAPRTRQRLRFRGLLFNHPIRSKFNRSSQRTQSSNSRPFNRGTRGWRRRGEEMRPVTGVVEFGTISVP